MKALATSAAFTASLLLASFAGADEPPPPTDAAQVDLTKDTHPVAEGDVVAPEAPPPAPYKKTLVIDSSVGALGFLGKFGHVAPTAPWLHTQIGYEFFRWLMVYGEGELAFSDTSKQEQQPDTRTFTMFGFGGGARLSVRPTERFGLYLQGGLGALKADIPVNALGILGYKDAESLGLYFGGRLGVEWFQVDRHFAIGANVGLRLAEGFAKSGGGDTPLAIDGGASLRYAF
jgi:hypothetical protein